MASGVVAGLLIFIVIVVGIMGIISISSEFENQYNTSDKVNTTGIYTNGSTPYESVKTIETGFMNSAPAGILLAFLLAVILVVLAVWAILKKGD